MKIRYKITLWIACAGVLTSLIFSVVVLWEMMEQPYRLIDKDLENMAKTVVRLVDTSQKYPDDSVQKELAFDTERYWIKIFDDHMKVLYQSKLTQYTDLPLHSKNRAYMVERIILRERINLGQDRKNEVAFRIKIVNAIIWDQPCMVQVGKPVEKLEEEIVDLIQVVAFGLIVITLLLIVLSYFIAGKILKPINVINRMARDINDRSLDRRIPLGKSRDELYELSTSLNRMFDRLQYSFATQKQFIADASHELKSPITLLSLFMEDSIHHQDLPESFRLRMIRQTDILNRMSRLVKNLLDLSALEMKESINFEDLNLSDLIKSIHDDYADVLSAKQIDVVMNIPEDFRIRGNRDSLHRALINLIDNAIKYNVDKGRIEISVKVKNRNIDLSIFNTGKGIPEKDINRVFEQFYRVEKSRSSQYGGSGLGLTIVKRIIELHRGNITIESDPETWTRINIHLSNQVNSSSRK